MITALFVGFKVRFQEIRKKEKLHEQENNDEFDDDDNPKLFPNGHVFKTMVIKKENIYKNSFHRNDLPTLVLLHQTIHQLLLLLAHFF